jgi:hypothetical protein
MFAGAWVSQPRPLIGVRARHFREVHDRLRNPTR